MNKNRKRFLALSLASIGAFGAFASVSAASLKPGTPKADRELAHTAIKEAITTGDYQMFLAATKNTRSHLPVITEVQFNAIASAEKLRVAGDLVGAKKILEDAGIKRPEGKMGKHKHHN